MIDPSLIQLTDFLGIVDYLNADKAGKQPDKQLFKIANDKLVAFSKTEQAWVVCF